MLYAYLPPGSSDPSGAFQVWAFWKGLPAWRHVWLFGPLGSLFQEPSPASSSLYSRVLTVGFTVGPILFYGTVQTTCQPALRAWLTF